MQFDMTKTWDRAVQLFSNNFQILAIIAGVFLLLPSIIMYIAVPEFANMEAMIDPDGKPDKVMAQLAEMAGDLIGWSLLTIATSFAGYAAMTALVGERGITVGEAIVRGLKSIPTLFGVGLIFFIAYMVSAIIVFLPFGILAAIAGGAGPVFTILGVAAIFVIIVYLMARFSVALPVIMMEHDFNPVTAMIRSWRLTGAHHWRLLGFWLLLMVVYFVILLLVGGAINALAALTSGTTAGLIAGAGGGILSALAAMIFSTIAVAIYQQVSGDGPKSVSETFT